MHDTITKAFAPLIGLPCWGVDRVQGSILSFEFGSPYLVVREPIVSASPSARIRQRMAQRRVKPVGEWNLFIFSCHWRIVASGEGLADDECEQGQIEAALQIVDGQKLTAFTLDAPSRTTTFAFDLGAILTTWPCETNDHEQWSLYLPCGHVVTYRADGCFSLGPGDGKPGQEVWQPLACNVLVP